MQCIQSKAIHPCSKDAPMSVSITIMLYEEIKYYQGQTFSHHLTKLSNK